MEPIAIVLNGASSSGKSSVAKAMQGMWPSPLIHASLDAFTDVFDWPSIEGDEVRRGCHRFGVDSFHGYLETVAASEFSVVVDHVFEQRVWFENTRSALSQRRTVYVGVRCDLAILEEREKQRGDRRIGLSRMQHQRVHEAMTYDLEVDTGKLSAVECAQLILEFVRPE